MLLALDHIDGWTLTVLIALVVLFGVLVVGFIAVGYLAYQEQERQQVAEQHVLAVEGTQFLLRDLQIAEIASREYRRAGEILADPAISAEQRARYEWVRDRMDAVHGMAAHAPTGLMPPAPTVPAHSHWI